MVKKRNLSDIESTETIDASETRIGIIVSDWNKKITQALLEGAIKTLKAGGILNENIIVYHVPGSYELPQAAAKMHDAFEIDAVICLGCIIQGETRHFEFIAQAVAQQCQQVAVNTLKPVIFGVLTTDTYEQALDRAGGKHGNKGDEAAHTALQMASLYFKMNQEGDDPFDLFDPFDDFDDDDEFDDDDL